MTNTKLFAAVALVVPLLGGCDEDPQNVRFVDLNEVPSTLFEVRGDKFVGFNHPLDPDVLCTYKKNTPSKVRCVHTLSAF